jgi:peptide deformylase
MAIREIITVPNPLLKQVSKPVEKVDDALRALMDDMLETMYDAPGIGLAAIQIGEPVRVIVMDLQEKPESAAEDAEPVKNPRYFVNPEIIWKSEDTLPYEEGCLSIPEIYDEVQRPAHVKIRYLNYQGEQVEEEAEGLYAVCIQHEMDHLEGVLFIDHLSKL